MADAPPPPLIEGLVHEEQLTIIHGPPESGKTYFTTLMGEMAAGAGEWGGKFNAPEDEDGNRRPVRVIYVLTDGSKFDMAERIRWGFKQWPAADLNFLAYVPPLINLRSKEGLDELIEICAGFDVIMLDSLTSMSSGDISDNVTMQEVMQNIRVLKMAQPGRGVVVIHHDHRAKRDSSGDLIDEGKHAIAGSFHIGGQADLIWHITRSDPGRNAAAKVEQVKGRSRYRSLWTDSFYVHMDPDTGELTSEALPDTAVSKRIADWLKLVGSTSTKDVEKWAGTSGIGRTTVMRYLKGMVDTGEASRLGRGQYQYKGKIK